MTVNSAESLQEKIAQVRAAQKIYATFTQEKVDEIFRAAATAANNARISLAKLAVEETGMGIVEDKVIKNNYAAEYIYNAYKMQNKNHSNAWLILLSVVEFYD